MSKDSLKFFQNYIREMADIGGENLPKSVSTKLGTKLGKIYKDRNPSANLETNLKQIYKVLKAKPKIRKINENKLGITVIHRKKFCPIGGNYQPERAEFVNNNICIPFTLGFLHELEPELTFEHDLKSCILSNNNSKTCYYTLKMEAKQN
jgi:hypothetical protein